MTTAATQTGMYIDDAAQIRWPDGFAPKDATFFIHNETLVDAPPEYVWRVLVEAEKYPTYYEGAKNVIVHDGIEGRLVPNSSFNWLSVGWAVHSTVRTFEPNQQLSWSFRRKLFSGVHAWLLVPESEGSKTALITQETQVGPMAHIQNVFAPRMLYGFHELWLAGIKAIAESRAERSRTSTRWNGRLGLTVTSSPQTLSCSGRESQQ